MRRFSNRLIKGRTVSFIKNEESRSARYLWENVLFEKKINRQQVIKTLGKMEFAGNRLTV
jgi:hypothetical protein